MKYGLALAGGGARGAAHAGVLLALKEENLLPDVIGGTSAGSIAAGLFAAGMEPEELCELVRHLAEHGPDYLDLNLLSLLGLIPQMLLGLQPRVCGLLKGKRLHTLLHGLTGKQQLEQLNYPLFIPAVDLHTGITVCFTNYLHLSPASDSFYTNIPLHTNTPFLRSVKTGEPGKEQQIIWKNSGFLSDIILASSSVPGIFCPVRMNSFCLVDGGITNNLPVDLMRAAGVKTVAAVDIGSPYRMPEEESIFEILSHSFSIMSANLKDCRSMGETVLLTPSLPEDAGLFSFHRMEACMDAAYRHTKEHIHIFHSLSESFSESL